ncbi:MAG: LEA type 2 family protein [candidate division WOR-3 bacterium]|nr:MAG: LEA type 2 family protein [candidate division WOR-3 bacterium]
MKSGLLFGIPLLLLAASCRPRLRPVEADYTRITIEEMERAVVQLRIVNPNRFSLDIENLHYALLLAEDTLARGARRTPVHVESQDTTLADFPFTLGMSVSDLIKRLPDLLEDTVKLSITGRYSLPSIFGPKHRPFLYQKAVPLADELKDIIAPFEELFDADNWFRRSDR